MNFKTARMSHSKWVGIIAIKNKGTQIHFLSDVLVVVASLDLKVPLAFHRMAVRSTHHQSPGHTGSPLRTATIDVKPFHI